MCVCVVVAAVSLLLLLLLVQGVVCLSLFFPLLFFFLWLHGVACGFLVPQPGDGPGPLGWER